MTVDPRIDRAEALRLLTHGDLAELIARADAIRRKRHGRKTYFVHSLNLNPTNVCDNHCELCAFWRDPDAPDAYLLTLDRAGEILHAARPLGLTEVHIVGGVRKELDLAYYESLLRLVHEVLPGVLIQGLTAVEVWYLARLEPLPVATVLQRLQAAGLGAIPGGGAEIFAPEARKKICSRKISADQWLDVHEQAHALGLGSNATMLLGHVETPADIVDHLLRLRTLQDRTGGLNAFIPLPFHAAGTKLDAGPGPTGHVIARVAALARIVLDNVPHIRVLANYMDRRLLSALTHAGIDDVGGTSLDERIAQAAGAPAQRQVSTPEEMRLLLADLGLEMVLTDSAYRGVGGEEEEEEEEEATRAGRARPLNARGERISAEEAVCLHEQVPLGQLGAMAHERRMTMVPARQVTFVLDRNISFTNVCEAACRFCAYHVKPGSHSPKAFTLSIEEILGKISEATDAGATQVLLQGGLNPELDLAFYERMFAAIKASHDVWVHSLSPAEVAYLSQRSGLTITETLERLRAAGLDSLPGGGAEILVDDIRRRVSPRKISAVEWLDVMRAAHGIGMKTTATMVYGLGETVAQRVEHLLAVRDLQDQTGGFTAFIPWSFQPEGTDLAVRAATAVDYLRVVALARLVLDNVPHLQAGTLTEGPDVAQLALSFGADDFGGVLMEERVIRATGAGYAVTRQQMLELIRQAGMTPVQRTTQYEVIHVFGAEGG